MELYQKHGAFNAQLFARPPAEYRGAPFWSWNTRLDQEQLFRQLKSFQQMGMGGFHIHVRTGLETEYLGQDFLRMVRACAEQARTLGLLVWLYDEDRWPSGSAGGLVTVDPRFRARHLLFTTVPYGQTEGVSKARPNSTARAHRTENGVLLARYCVSLEHGGLADYRTLAEHEPIPTEGTVWYAYLETARPSPWFNHQTYVDTLQPAAIQRFLQTTHERYARTVGDFFGTLIPAIFTDEPQFAHKTSLRFAEDTADLFLSWTDDLLTSYEITYHQSLLDHLPELFWDFPDKRPSLARYQYHDHLSERFTSAFADTLGAWCRKHHLMLTGHLMEEPTLTSQTAALGEAMRSYRSFDLPGIDMLCDWHEYTTAKQAQSAAHQYARPGVLSELYGVTNWDFDFVGHKAQGDWQAALGVTVRVHHLTWVSMAGEAKRDYPASIGYQSPWFQEYPLVEDHFARLNTALTQGKALVRVGVIHPIESFWLCFGPLEQTGGEREEREQAFADLTHWLLFGLIDFDFIAESLLPSQCPQQTGKAFLVGEMRYDTIIVPAMRTIRSTTLQRLEMFREAGGMIVFAGEIPSLVDARPSARAHELATRCLHVALTRRQILEALEPMREIEVRLADGRRADTLLHQIRIDADQRFVFLCNTDKQKGRDQTAIMLKGAWKLTYLDTLTGQQGPLTSTTREGYTILPWSFPAHGSLLLRLEPGATDEGVPQRTSIWHERGPLHSPVRVTLSEPNVLMLDQARYALDEEPWQECEEVLRIDNILRERLGYALKMEAFAQPWVDPPSEPARHGIRLAFSIQVEYMVRAPQLALENAELTRITLDGLSVPKHTNGWFVDEAIQTIALPDLAVGAHELILELPYRQQTNLEWCYLLGDFGVDIRGRYASITQPVRSLAFGDWTRQGLPFYAGNVTYHCHLDGQEGNLAIQVPHFKAPLLKVELDGQDRGRIAFAPFQLTLGEIPSGAHNLDITAFGNRRNAFGCVHNANEHTTWFGPEAWRTTGEEWSYEYQLQPMGILVAPEVLIENLAP